MLMHTELSPEFVGTVIATVREAAGIDFALYRQPMLHRRISNHMIAAGSVSDDTYLKLLSTSSGFVRAAIERYTIKVSRFYRDPAVFARLSQHIQQAAATSCDSGLQLWSAGCAEGEEAYTLAMLLDDAGCAGTVLATDIDQIAMCSARLACYPESRLTTLPDGWRERYFEPATANRWRVRAHIRERVRFAYHDLAGATPIDGDSYAMICCRNVLIYFQPEAQRRALHHVTSALRPGGILALGEAEWPIAPATSALLPVSSTLRMFQRAARLKDVA